MKKYLSVITLAMLLMSMTKISAQTEGYQEGYFGIKAGLNATNISFEDLNDRSERFGYHVSIFADAPISPGFVSLQPELAYSVKGTAYRVVDVFDKQHLKMNYLDLLVPVAFHLSSVDIQVGPFASMLVSTRDYDPYGEDVVIVDAFKKYDVGLTAGLGFNFNRFMLGLRYNQGLMDITTDNGRAILGPGKNAVGQVSLGVKF